MTDATLHKAVAMFGSGSIKTEARITCSTDRATYTISTFDEAGQAEPMLTDYGKVSAMVRIDDQPAGRLSHRPKFLNQFELVDDEGKLPAASALTLRLYTAKGEETVRIDQSDAALRPMLDQCAQSLAAKTKRVKAANEAYAADHYARCGDHPCPIDTSAGFVTDPVAAPGASPASAAPGSESLPGKPGQCDGSWAYLGRKGQGDGLSVNVSPDTIKVQFLDFGSAYGPRTELGSGSVGFQDAQDGSPWTLSCTPSGATLSGNGRTVPLVRSSGDIFALVKRKWGEDYTEND